jgi:sec-independent protein translocase protein TatA
MGGFSLWHILIFAIILLLLFGGNRFSAMMGDVAKGLKSFKQGMSDEDKPHDAQRPDPRQLPPQQQPPIDVTPQPRAAEPRAADPSKAEPTAPPPTDDSAR